MTTVEEVPGWFPDTNAAAFWAVIRDCAPKTVVEIGSYLGRSTVLLGKAMKTFSGEDARLISIDPHTGDRQQLERLHIPVSPTLPLFRVHIEGAGLADMVDVRVGTSDSVAVDWTDPIDLLFVDGWHSYEAVRSDIRNWTRHLTADGLVCFDDFGHYSDVRQAVLDGCAEEGLTVYGSILAHAWAGRRPRPPSGLVRALRYAGLHPHRPTP
jgi:predicted O-methyltransferase YrrM